MIFKQVLYRFIWQLWSVSLGLALKHFMEIKNNLAPHKLLLLLLTGQSTSDIKFTYIRVVHIYMCLKAALGYLLFKIIIPLRNKAILRTKQHCTLCYMLLSTMF